jgi:hypothetical protein
MVDIDAAFLRDFLKVAIGDRIAHIEKDRVPETDRLSAAHRR